MKVMEKNVMRLVAVQHLRSAFGIKTKNWNKNKAASWRTTASTSTKVFGVSLESLPYYNMECGRVPSFLVDACMKLQAHVDTEGLFRKSGSVIRLKALRAKLDMGEEYLSSALPCDVAGLVKQFFRELPEPVLPTELQEAFLKAQQLPTEEERTSATMLLSCVLPDKNLSVLRHFFDFLNNVSKRCAENKMDSSNLSVILAPNLLHFGESTEKMNTNTEKRLKLEAAIVQCFIENAHSFGVLPQFLQEKIPAMLGCESGVQSPTHEGLEELDLNSGMKKRRRRSFGDMVNGALNKIKTNRTPTHASQSDSLAYSASGVLDTSHNALSPAGRSRRQSATSVRRKSRRLSNRHAVHRVESGTTGCFSPKVDKKEAPRKSLRLRFSLGKSSKEAGSESIGWRLATQESTASFCFTKETEFSPSVLPRKAESKSSKFISKSEDNLLTPQCDSGALGTSWSGETPVGGGSFTDTPMNMCLKSTYKSEPAIVISKPPVVASLPKKLCCASSAESLESERSITEEPTQSGPTLLKIKKSGSDLLAVAQEPCTIQPQDCIVVPPPESPSVNVDTKGYLFQAQQSHLGNDQNITFGHFEIAALSPLHIDSVIFESGAFSPAANAAKESPCAAPISSHNNSMVGESDGELEQVNCSRLIDALDIHSPALFKLGVSSGLQSTPYKRDLDLPEEFGTPKLGTTVSCSAVHEENESCHEIGAEFQNQQALSPRSLETEKRRVADHIQHFNKLTLHSPRGPKGIHTRSPLKFTRTPVRQTVRRMNSLLGEGRRPSRKTELTINQGAQVVKAVSLESGLSPHPQLKLLQREAQVGLPKKKPPPVPPKKPSTLARKAKACALGDVTNKVQAKTKVDSSVPGPPAAQKPLVQQLAEKDMNHYRGSPRNPLNQACLLPATKPVDL
ncbi:rho GTPase-activating protein 11A isoform X3 [Labrus mixtus]|uniref:rho GTPase-activating protein 11A isoform X3 n=1 Tax=Labrus mixtus TaxID=508554 RepID=UPI0029C0E379|nr:rho GTPase-activating protein 11A isoform X3 [Labrus mixtus]